MNEKVLDSMISFIEEKEKQLQLEKLSTGQVKNDIVKLILEELERVMPNED